LLLRIEMEPHRTGAYIVRSAYLHHIATRPLVYLDHWAMMLFASDAGLRRRLADALHGSGGALCIAPTHGGELCRVDDPRHAKDFDALLAAVWPNVFFIHVPQLLKQRDRTTPLPPGDMHGATEAFRHYRHERGYFENLWAMGRTQRPGRKTLTETFDTAAANTASKIDETRQDEVFKAKARVFELKNGRSRAWVILGELLRPTVLNDAQRFTVNDGADMQHALALVHCDYVLLDAAWTARVESGRRRLREAGVELGKVYSQRANGVERFLANLEAGAAAHP
jgi:hypothetical protein